MGPRMYNKDYIDFCFVFTKLFEFSLIPLGNMRDFLKILKYSKNNVDSISFRSILTPPIYFSWGGGPHIVCRLLLCSGRFLICGIILGSPLSCPDLFLYTITLPAVSRDAPPTLTYTTLEMASRVLLLPKKPAIEFGVLCVYCTLYTQQTTSTSVQSP
jgi:hypothetical protein